MPIPHYDYECHLRVAKITFPLLLMQYRFFCDPNAASQVPIFQTQTFLHLIFRLESLLHCGESGSRRHGHDEAEVRILMCNNIPTPELSCRSASTRAFGMRIPMRGISHCILELVMLCTG